MSLALSGAMPVAFYDACALWAGGAVWGGMCECIGRSGFTVYVASDGARSRRNLKRVYKIKTEYIVIKGVEHAGRVRKGMDRNLSSSAS